MDNYWILGGESGIRFRISVGVSFACGVCHREVNLQGGGVLYFAALLF